MHSATRHGMAKRTRGRSARHLRRAMGRAAVGLSAASASFLGVRAAVQGFLGPGGALALTRPPAAGVVAGAPTFGRGAEGARPQLAQDAALTGLAAAAAMGGLAACRTHHGLPATRRCVRSQRGFFTCPEYETTSTATSIHEFTVKDIELQDVSLSKYAGKVCLVVNVASE